MQAQNEKPSSAVRSDQAPTIKAGGKDGKATQSANTKLSPMIMDTTEGYAVSGLVASNFNQQMQNVSPFTDYQLKQLRAQCIVFMSLRCEKL